MNNSNRVTKWALVLGIVIVLNLFFGYTLSLVYKEPVYTDFCPNEQVINVPQDQSTCVSKGGQWTSDQSYYAPTKPVPVGGIAPTGYCNLQYTCGTNYQNAEKTYARNIFVILVLLGSIIVFLGNMIKGNEVITNGLSLAGVLTFIIASGRYWSSANDAFRVIILAIALAILFWIAWKKFGTRPATT